MKNQKLLASLAILAIAFLGGCIKDNYKEVISLCPVVVSVNPADGTSNVPFNQLIKVNFNEKMNGTTINTATFTVRGSATVAGVVSYSDSTAVFTPLNPLTPNTTYTARITTSVKDLAGNALQEDYIWSFSTGAFFIDLQSVARFGILAATGVDNMAGASLIQNFDVGISPGSRSLVTGFPPAIIFNGAIYAANDVSPEGIPAMLQIAKQELSEAYLAAKTLSFPAATTISGDLGGTTLAPGIYTSNTSLLIQSGDLTLDAQGDPNAVWVFQIASGLTTVGGAGGSVVLKNGAKADNIFWQVGSSATVGDYTNFNGNILAFTSITLKAGSIIKGRLLALNGAVNLTDANILIKP